MVNRWPRTQASQGSRAGRRPGSTIQPHWRNSTSSPNLPFQFRFLFFLNPNPTSQPMYSSSTSSSAPQPIPVLTSLCHCVPSLRVTFQLPTHQLYDSDPMLPLSGSTHHPPSTETTLVLLFNPMTSTFHETQYHVTVEIRMNRIVNKESETWVWSWACC